MVNAYEIELLIAERPGRPAKTVVRTEYAYSVMDAAMQAGVNYNAENPTDADGVSIRHVGPPARAIEVATAVLSQEIDRAVAALRVKR